MEMTRCGLSWSQKIWLIKRLTAVIVIITVIYHLAKVTIIQKDSQKQMLVPSNSCRRHFRPISLPLLTSEEKERINKCVSTRAKQRKWSELHWKKGTDENSHTYLTPDSNVIEIGGNIGVFSKNMIRKYKLKKYTVFEPMPRFYNNLTLELAAFPGKIEILNYGLGDANRVLKIRDMGDGSSAFHQMDDVRYTERPMSTIHIRDARDVLASLGIGCHDLDLLSMNCEGCEMELLELFTRTTMIKYIKNIQFQLHVNLAHLQDAERRYCTIRERLKKTHTVLYAYPYIWESWTRKKI